MIPKLIEIINPDGTSSKITVFEGLRKPQNVVFIIFPAMGVDASYYQPLAKAICDMGYVAVTADHRGHGHSSIRPGKEYDFGYKEMLIQDFNSVVDKIKHIYSSKKLILLGHSLGGQHACLFAGKYPEGIDGILLIAASTVYYKSWKGINRYKTLIYIHLLRTISKVLGYYPGTKVGFAGLEAKTVMMDWSSQGISGKYILANDEFDYENAMQKLRIPCLAISFEKDALINKRSVEHLYKKLGSKTKHIELLKNTKTEKVFSHFSWVKMPRDIVFEIDKWIGTAEM